MAARRRAQQTAGNGEQEQAAGKARPVKVIRIRNIRGNIWSNQAQNGRTFHSVTIDRLWKDEDELGEDGQVVKKGEWRQSSSFGADDLLIAAKVADLCHSWICRQRQDRNDGF